MEYEHSFPRCERARCFSYWLYLARSVSTWNQVHHTRCCIDDTARVRRRHSSLDRRRVALDLRLPAARRHQRWSSLRPGECLKSKTYRNLFSIDVARGTMVTACACRCSIMVPGALRQLSCGKSSQFKKRKLCGIRERHFRKKSANAKTVPTELSYTLSSVLFMDNLEDVTSTQSA